MKKYIFFTYTIKDVGGGQLYVSTKASYLHNNGWDIIIIYITPGELIIKSFQSYKLMENVLLNEPAIYYFKSKRKKILNQIVDFVGSENVETVIESHSDILATWGELLASKINAKHIVYLIAEKLEMRPWYYEYLRFKYERRELASITKDSIAQLFAKTDCVLKYGSPFLSAYGAGKSVFDVDYNIVFDPSLFTIGLVGRMEKEYMGGTVGEIIFFLHKHSDVLFNVVYIGGEPQNSGIIESIKKQYDNVNNVNLFFTGYIFPMPRKLIKEIDICISGAGSAGAVTREGIPTIVVDPRTLKSDGVLSITAFHSIWASENSKSIDFWLEEVFSNHEKYIPQVQQIHPDWTTHESFLERSAKDKAYNLSFLDYRSPSLFMTKIARLFLPKQLFYRLSKTTSKLRKK